MSRALGNPLPIVAPRSGISLPHPTGPDLFCWHIRKGRPRRAYSLKAMGDLSESYSLWFKPPAGPLAVQLVQEVAAQAKDFGGPLFEPHVTLLGGISCDRDNALATSQQLANKLKKFRLNFLDVSHGSTFHRCVYILVAKEAAIMQAGQLARQEFSLEGDYMPHLSLLYADLGVEAVHQAQQAAVHRLYGEGSNYSTLLTDNGFTVDAVTLWYTPEEDRSLNSWKQIAEFQLQE